LAFDLPVPHPAVFQGSPREVFSDGRNNLVVSRLALTSAIEHIGVPATRAVVFPKQEEASNGTL
jgi:hypothetical protein